MLGPSGQRPAQARASSDTVWMRSPGSGRQAPAIAACCASFPRKADRPSPPSPRNTDIVRPSVNTVVRSSITAPRSNSSGAMKRVEPNIRPMSLTNEPSQ